MCFSLEWVWGDANDVFSITHLYIIFSTNEGGEKASFASPLIFAVEN